MSMFNLIKILTDAEVEFVLVGGLAVALHGYQRVTMDIDVVLAPCVRIVVAFREKGNSHRQGVERA